MCEVEKYNVWGRKIQCVRYVEKVVVLGRALGLSRVRGAHQPTIIRPCLPSHHQDRISLRIIFIAIIRECLPNHHQVHIKRNYCNVREPHSSKQKTTCNFNPSNHLFLMLDISSNVFIWTWIELIIIAINLIMLPKDCERSGAYERGTVSSHCHQDTVTTSTHSSSSPSLHCCHYHYHYHHHNKFHQVTFLRITNYFHFSNPFL